MSLFAAVLWYVSWAVLLFGLVFLLLLYGVFPIRLWRSHRRPAYYRLFPQSPELFLARVPAATAQDRALQSLGFQPVQASEFTMSDAQGRLLLYRRDPEGLLALLVWMNAGPEAVLYGEFAQMHADGSVLSVFNAPVPSPYPPLPWKRLYRLPDVVNMNVLWSVFECLRREDTHAIPMAVPAGQELEILERSLNREVDELVALGWLSPRIEPGGLRRLTLKGAFLLTWKSLGPLKSWLQRRDEERSRRLQRHFSGQ